MSDLTTKRMLALYVQDAPPTLFFTGMFGTRPENFHNSEEVEIDIERTEEDIAIVITDLSTGYRMNSDDVSTNKSFTPPIFKEAGAINGFDLIKRMPGQNPFEDPSFQANANFKAFKLFRKLENKVKRTMELQSSQVLQTGQITLKNDAGVDLYTLDYKPKATHFPTAGTAWNAGGSTKAADLSSLAQVIRADGLVGPDTLVFGVDAFESFVEDSDVRDVRFNMRRGDLGTIVPLERRGEGGEFRGTVEIGNYKYDMWTYDGSFKDPQTGVSTFFMDPGKVIVMASGGRKDATFGAIPRIAPVDSRALPFLPPRMSMPGIMMDMFTNAWITPDGEQLFVGAGARPLMIPTAIDTYGCLITGL